MALSIKALSVITNSAVVQKCDTHHKDSTLSTLHINTQHTVSQYWVTIILSVVYAECHYADYYDFFFKFWVLLYSIHAECYAFLLRSWVLLCWLLWFSNSILSAVMQRVIHADCHAFLLRSCVVMLSVVAPFSILDRMTRSGCKWGTF